jgi:hypothetical protein
MRASRAVSKQYQVAVSISVVATRFKNRGLKRCGVRGFISLLAEFEPDNGRQKAEANGIRRDDDEVAPHQRVHDPERYAGGKDCEHR